MSRQPTNSSPSVGEALPPNDPEAEAGVLACVLSSVNGEAEAMLDQLSAEDFYDLRHKEIFGALRCLRIDGKPLDVVAVHQWAKSKRRQEECGGVEYLTRLPDLTPSPAMWPTWLETVKDKATRRAVTRDAAELEALANDTAIPAKVLRDAARKFAEAYKNGETNGCQARPIGTLSAPVEDDQEELIERRFLCRGAGMLLVGQSGQGKSSLSVQMAILFALGKSCFGFRPTRPLKTLIIQAENDDGDMYEMFNGICEGLELTDAQRRKAGEAVLLCTEDALAGEDFLAKVVIPLIEKHKPDLVIIDPAFAFVGGDTKDAEVVGRFLRRGLNPVLHKYRCAALIVHHPAKTKPDGRQVTHDFLYAGAGSIEWSNWARAVLALETKGNGYYQLHAPKRGSRLGWCDEAGNMIFDRYLRHSRKQGVICWHEAEESEVQSAAKPGKSPADLLALVPATGALPKTVLIEKASAKGIGTNRSRAFLDEMLASGQLHEWRVKRSGTNPEKWISRHRQKEEK